MRRNAFLFLLAIAFFPAMALCQSDARLVIIGKMRSYTLERPPALYSVGEEEVVTFGMFRVTCDVIQVLAGNCSEESISIVFYDVDGKYFDRYHDNVLFMLDRGVDGTYCKRTGEHSFDVFATKAGGWVCGAFSGLSPTYSNLYYSYRNAVDEKDVSKRVNKLKKARLKSGQGVPCSDFASKSRMLTDADYRLRNGRYVPKYGLDVSVVIQALSDN
ncbi:MAG: hypothetical protein J5732_09735 [Bacteroidaceae bacterium]|nr:hypothetical protein [Bacteroidaceae bacterium]